MPLAGWYLFSIGVLMLQSFGLLPRSQYLKAILRSSYSYPKRLPSIKEKRIEPLPPFLSYWRDSMWRPTSTLSWSRCLLNPYFLFLSPLPTRSPLAFYTNPAKTPCFILAHKSPLLPKGSDTVIRSTSLENQTKKKISTSREYEVHGTHSFFPAYVLLGEWWRWKAEL